MNDLSDLAPHSLDAERAVIGAVLLDGSAHDRVSDLLGVDDFYSSQHRIAWTAIEHCAAHGKTPDPVTVAEAVPPPWRPECPFEFLQGLMLQCATAFNARRYAEIVRDRRIRRDLMAGAERLRELAMTDQGRPAADVLDEAQSVLLALGQGTATGADGVDIRTALNAVLDDVQTRMDNPDALGGAPTGLADLDERTDGLQAGDLIVLAGRPSMGKTALAMGVARNVAAGGRTALVFSLEMPASQIAQRMLASEARVNLQDLRRARLTTEDWMQLSPAIGRLADMPLRIDDSAPLTVARLRARAKRAARRAEAANAPLGLIVVDYLQLMSGDGENRNTVISDISRGLKLLAKELRIPVVALSQLSREVEKRTNRRPMMSDLRDSGAIEQDSDLIIFIYRDQVYNPDSPDVGTAELIIGKQRNGPPGMVRVEFAAEEATFRTLPRSWEPEPRTKPQMGPRGLK